MIHDTLHKFFNGDEPRPRANGYWQLWHHGGRWYAIEPDGSISDVMREGATPEESRQIAYQGIDYLNSRLDRED